MLSDEQEVPEPRVELYGLKVTGDKPVSIAPHLTDEDGSSVSLHLTQIALGAKPSAGPHTVFAKLGGSQFAVGTLEKGRCEQFSVDYMLTTDASFSHSGSSEVFLTGYRHISPLLDNMAGMDEYSEEDDDEDDEEDDEAPALRAITAGGKGQKANGRVRMLVNKFSEGDDDDLEAIDDDDDDDDDIEDDLLADAADEDSDDLPVAAPLAAAAGKKRSAAAALTAGDAAPKKAKTPAAAAAPPAVAPAAAAPVAQTGQNAAWAKAVRDFIQGAGPSRLSELGTKVPKPAGVTIKVKKCLEESGLFAIDATGIVSLRP
ncbi:hypothetical protein WJX73_003476 [Symbiochloris irregularis]|uniref:Nucleoplasmin-like domain-containing protein n=1 Tax=Symbiochloris irregularis TaxID=706552 RepID=A0AAW1PL95_9CHLO